MIQHIAFTPYNFLSHPKNDKKRPGPLRGPDLFVCAFYSIQDAQKVKPFFVKMKSFHLWGEGCDAAWTSKGIPHRLWETIDFW